MTKLGKSQVLLVLRTELENKLKDDLYILPSDKRTKEIDAILTSLKDSLLQSFTFDELSEDISLQLFQKFTCGQKNIIDMFVSLKKHVDVEIEESIDGMLEHIKAELIAEVEYMRDPKYKGQGNSRREQFHASSVQPLKGTDIS